MPEDWDDAMHIESNASILPRSIEQHPLPTPALSSPSERKNLVRSDEDLGERIDQGTCQYIKTCSLLALQQTTFHLLAVTAAFIHVGEQILQLGQEYGPSLWKFLNQPLIVGLTIGSGTGALSGAVSAWTSASIAESECSKAGTKVTDANIIEDMVNKLGSAQPYRSVSASIQIGDVTANITLEAVPHDQEFEEGCRPPPRNLIADGVNFVDENQENKELISIEGLTRKEYQESTTALAIFEPSANQTNSSTASLASAPDYLPLSKDNVHVKSTKWIGTKGNVANLLISTAGMLTSLTSALGNFWKEKGNEIMIYKGRLSMQVSAANGQQLTMTLIIGCLEFFSRFADKGILITHFTYATAVLSVVFQAALVLDDLPKPWGLRISATTLDPSQPAIGDTGRRFGQFGHRDGNTKS